MDGSDRRAAIGTAAFLVLAPGVVGGLVPWWITDWRVRDGWPLLLQIAGATLAAAGVAVLLSAFVRFVTEGGGTPAPVAPTERLVVGGWYRYVRNPMYLAVAAIILGQYLVLGRPALLVWALLFGVAVYGFVTAYEEPVLRRRYGAAYEAYRAAVPGWWPRRTAWSPPA